MKTEKIEDEDLCDEVPIYFSKSLIDMLYLIHYPNRPKDRPRDDEPVLKAQVKPINGQIELEVGIQTRSPYYSRSKGEQIVLNVDGAGRNQKAKEDNYFPGMVMDKITYTSTKCSVDVENYAIGVMSEGCLHLSALTSMIALKPSCEYLELAEKRKKLDNKDQVEDMDVEESTKKVTVRFERPETDRSRDMKEKSYNFIQKKIRDEPWIPVDYHKIGSDPSKSECRNLYCDNSDEGRDLFGVDSEKYLNNLIPQEEEVADSEAEFPGSHVSATAPKALPLMDRVKNIMENAGIASFNEITYSIANKSKSEDPAAILKSIQQHAVLVQGNWVLKSEILYPKEEFSESNVPNEILQRTRDCILYQFTKNSTVTRTSITELINVPRQDLTKIFRSVAKNKGERGTWEFLLPLDNNFIKIHPEVVQRQQMIWQSRYENLSQHFIKKK